MTQCPQFSVAPAGSSSLNQCTCQANSAMVNGLCMCNDGYVLDASMQCSLCPANAFCPDQITIKNCSNYGLSLPGQSSPNGCNRCPTNYAQNSLTTSPISCRPCMSGYVCPNATIETKCLAGTYALGTACTGCPANSYSLDAAAACTQCDPQATSPANSITPSACTCNPGFFRDGAYNCVRCPSGYYCINNLVTPCENGTFSVGQQGICTPCPPGLYQNIKASSACKACPGGIVIQRSTPSIEPMPDVHSRAYTATGSNNGLFISMNYIQTGQGANISSWAFWATQAGCVVTPLIFTGTVTQKGVGTGPMQFQLAKKGTTRNTTKAGYQNFSFIDNAPTYLAPSYGYSVDSNHYMTQTYFGWAFTGAACISFDVSGTGQSFSVFTPGAYNPIISQYNYDGSVLPTQIWSVTVASTLTQIINSTLSPGNADVMSCLCPDGTQQINTGQCQGLCPDGKYMPGPNALTCIPCPKGSFCANSNISVCPVGTSSLAGASSCSPCISPGGGTNIQLYTCGLLSCTPNTPIPLGTSPWSGLGTINVNTSGVDRAPYAPWQPSGTILSMVLNPAVDRPFALLQTVIDLSLWGEVGQELAIQFKYQCTGVSCPDYLSVDLSQDLGVTFKQLLYITDFTSSIGNWVTIASNFFIVTTDPNTSPPPIYVRFSSQLKVSSSKLWLGAFEIVSLGYWQYSDITKLRLLTTDTVAVPRVNLTSGYFDQTPATNFQINSTTINVDLTPLVATASSPTGVNGVAIFPNYTYYASVWASGNGTLTLRVNGVDSVTKSFSTSNAFQIWVATTQTPTSFVLQSLGPITVKAPSLTIRSRVVGCQPCLANYWCYRGAFSSCPDHSISLPSAAAQTDCFCVPGYYGKPGSVVFSTPCTICPIGSFCLGGNQIQVCPNGTKATSPGSTACTICAVDEYCAFGKNTSCPDHATSPVDSWDVTQCICDPGYYGIAPNCKLCEVGSYCYNGSKTACTDHAVSPAGSYDPSQCYCDRGYEGVNNTACQPCTEGSFCWTGIKVACPNNMWSPALSSYQANCTCDYGAYPVSVACTLCAAGTYKSVRGAVTCSICGAGTFSTTRGATSSGVCVGCAAGTYSLGAGQYQCQPCLAGKYSTGVASSSCSSCWAGSYATMGASGCTVCSAGTFSTTVAAGSRASCATCSSGAYAVANSTTCSLCGACPYWKFPATIYFQYGNQVSLFSSSNKYYKFAVSNIDGTIYMAMNTAIYTIDLTTGLVSSPLPLKTPSPLTPWWFASIAPSVLGNYLYMIQNQDVFRMNLDMLGVDNTYPSRLATCILEDSTDLTSILLWIVQPTMVRKLDPLAAADIASYSISGANYACVNPLDSTLLYVTGTFGLKSLNKATGVFTSLTSGASYTVCQVTSDGFFVIMSSPTLKKVVAYSLFDGTSFNINGGSVSGLLFSGSNLILGIDSVGVTNISYVSADSRTCPQGQYGENTGMTSAGSCLLCSPGNLCPSGPNVSSCAPGTYSSQTGLREQAQCLPCPAGFFCQGGVCPGGFDCSINAAGICSGPNCINGNVTQTCPKGSYSTQTKLSNPADCPLCVAGYYCPDTVTMIPCPDNTWSDAGKSDLSDCQCAPGYQCIITKVVHAEVVLQMSIAAFTPDLQAKYLAAIAAAAGVSVNLVSLQSVFSTTVNPTGRRLLGMRRGAWESSGIEIHTLIHQGHLVQLTDLDTHLTDQGLPAHHSASVTLHDEVVQTFRQAW